MCTDQAPFTCENNPKPICGWIFREKQKMDFFTGGVTGLHGDPGTRRR